ncbi:hypothetical protein Mal15_42630 [Stieleria maiorica]|uniref:Uncharacterized protein n=1 Tax=Stieleria maiorica TaxID=2795974 RepID=A0A5B9MH18_9BACT|nr:hypothetical protein Mal15_42630 [Stieleria maiorica]
MSGTGHNECDYFRRREGLRRLLYHVPEQINLARRNQHLWTASDASVRFPNRLYSISNERKKT